MKTFWAYVHGNKKWYAWLYINDELIKKLGEFDTKQEAIDAKEKYENETTIYFENDDEV